MHCRSRMLSVDTFHFITVVLLALFITPVVILVSIFSFHLFLIDLFHNLHAMADHDHDPTQYNPRWQDLEETYFDWRCIVCSIWRTSISLSMSLCNLTWIIPHGLNVTNGTPHPTPHGIWESLQVVRNKHFLCTFFAADSFRHFILYVLVALPPPFNVYSFRLCCVLLALKMT